MRAYTVFLRQEAASSMVEIKGNRKKAVEAFISYLAENPFDEGDFCEPDDTGRVTFTKIIRDLAVTFFTDHATCEIKILEVVQTP
ncbi:MAG: hypothetical protein AAGJ81_13980 [Verrucomicrobiota bacterium]